jgi:hypothetical protein
MKRCLDNVTKVREGSHIWKLLKATLPIFKETNLGTLKET